MSALKVSYSPGPFPVGHEVCVQVETVSTTRCFATSTVASYGLIPPDNQNELGPTCLAWTSWQSAWVVVIALPLQAPRGDHHPVMCCLGGHVSLLPEVAVHPVVQFPENGGTRIDEKLGARG